MSTKQKKLLTKDTLDLSKVYIGHFYCDSNTKSQGFFEEPLTCGSELKFEIEGKSI